MDIITSFDNQKVKMISVLKDKKFRNEYMLYVAEGLRWVIDAIKLDISQIETIVVRESELSLYKNRLIECGDEALSRTIILSDKVFDKLSLVENSQGILAILKIKQQEEQIGGDYCLFLDKIRDPGNMGTIIRTACAAGYRDIICNNCVDIYNPKVIRSCMSAILNMRFYYTGYEILQKLKADNYKIVAADMDGVSIFLLKAKPKKLCLIIGGEADGVSDEALDKIDYKVSIPMKDVESLNAAVSAGIIMYNLKEE